MDPAHKQRFWTLTTQLVWQTILGTVIASVIARDLEIYEANMDAFFVNSPESVRAKHFRYQAQQSDSARGDSILQASSHEVDLMSTSGHTWEYRRQGCSSCYFDNMIFDSTNMICRCSADCVHAFGVCLHAISVDIFSGMKLTPTLLIG